MKKEMLIVLCSILLGMGTIGYAAHTEVQISEPCMAWWSLLYERPNPDRLPVRVQFRWLKGLE